MLYLYQVLVFLLGHFHYFIKFIGYLFKKHPIPISLFLAALAICAMLEMDWIWKKPADYETKNIYKFVFNNNEETTCGEELRYELGKSDALHFLKHQDPLWPEKNYEPCSGRNTCEISRPISTMELGNQQVEMQWNSSSWTTSNMDFHNKNLIKSSWTINNPITGRLHKDFYVFSFPSPTKQITAPLSSKSYNLSCPYRFIPLYCIPLVLTSIPELRLKKNKGQIHEEKAPPPFHVKFSL